MFNAFRTFVLLAGMTAPGDAGSAPQDGPDDWPDEEPEPDDWT